MAFIFLTGEPNSDPRHPDYAPKIFNHSNVNIEKLNEDLIRYKRTVHRVQQKHENEKKFEAVDALLNLQDSFVADETRDLQELVDKSESQPPKIDINDALEKIKNLETENTVLKAELNDSRQEYTNLSDEYRSVKSELYEVQKKKEFLAFGECTIHENDKKTNFYTGLQSYLLFNIIFDFVSKEVVKSKTVLTLKDEFFLFLVKLRLNLSFEDIAYRSGASSSTVSRMFYKWLDNCFVKLQIFINWPSREAVRETLPNMFKSHFPHVVCIIDCTEVFIERPKRLLSRQQTYSNYKKHNTAKFLVAITPTGSFSFVSSAWGGRISDQDIVKRSGFLDKLVHQDQVLADRGFTCNELFAVRGAKLIIPSFTKGKSQLSAEEVEKSRRLAHVRIEVERLIGYLKSKYVILEGPIPLKLCKRSEDVDYSTLDKIATVCASFVNLSGGIVDVNKL